MLQKKTIDALEWIVNILNSKKIPYQISGGLAAKIYGSLRTLNDIDLDIPEDKFVEIYKEIDDYIKTNFQHFNDGKWDVDIITLNYKGQEIDIGGAYNTKVSNQNRTEWIAIPADFSKSLKLNIENIQINVMAPEKLIEYKKHLDGKHQLEDIEAVKKYIINNI